MVLSLLIVFLRIVVGLLLAALFIIAVVLFVPIRYEAQISKKNSVTADVRASWFLKILRFCYKKNPKKSYTKIIVFGKIIGGNKKRDTKIEKTEEEERVFREPVSEEPIKPVETVKSVEPVKPVKAVSQTEAEEITETAETDEAIETDEAYEDEDDKGGKWATVKYFFTHPDRNELITLTLRLCKELLIALKPKYLKLSAAIGTDDPALTGYLLGFIESVKPFMGLNITVKGNFEKTELSGDVSVKGTLFIYRLIFPLCKYALTKPVWKLIKKYFFEKDDENGYEPEQQS